jgi:hypothetical protein
MERFKILDLVMVDDDDVLIAGHARIEAAKPLGLSHQSSFSGHASHRCGGEGILHRL